MPAGPPLEARCRICRTNGNEIHVRKAAAVFVSFWLRGVSATFRAGIFRNYEGRLRKMLASPPPIEEMPKLS